MTLVGFSIGSWGIILYKLVQISRARRESERFISIFWESKNLAAIHTASVGLRAARSRRCSAPATRNYSS